MGVWYLGVPNSGIETVVLLWCCGSCVIYGVGKEGIIKGPAHKPVLDSPSALSSYAGRLGKSCGKRESKSYDQGIKSLPDEAGSRPGFLLKGTTWYNSPEGEDCLRGCSQMLKQLPPLLELQGCFKAGLWI